MGSNAMEDGRYYAISDPKQDKSARRVGIMVCVRKSYDTYLLPPSQLHHTPPAFAIPASTSQLETRAFFTPSSVLCLAHASARSLASAVKWRWVGWFGNEKGLARMRRDKRRKEGPREKEREGESKRMERTINTTQFGRRAACSREGKKEGWNMEQTRPRQGLPTATTSFALLARRVIAF